MAQTARKYQTYPTPLEQSPKQPRQPKQLVARKQRVHYSLFEVFFVIGILTMGLTMSLIIIQNSIALHDVNTKTNQLQRDIQAQIERNNELDAKILELSNPERILKKAEELGLMINEKNIQVIR